MTGPISNLSTLLATMRPHQRPGVFVYVRPGQDDPAPASYEALIREDEGPTFVMRASDAIAQGLHIEFRAAWITLTVHSDLAACGLTAAFSRALSDAGISCNVLAGALHDHLLVPIEQAEAALQCLRELSARAQVPQSGPIASSTCANCQSAMTGPFCAQCGQARFVESDRRLSHLLKQAFDHLTDFDSRLWRSLLALLFQPGRMTHDYLIGRRQYWMAPVSLFLLANVLYFFAPAVTDFDLPFTDQVPGELALPVVQARGPVNPELAAQMRNNGGQIHSAITANWVRARIAARDAAAKRVDPKSGYTVMDLARDYDARSHDVSKLLIILHVPIMALVLSIMLFPLRRYFAEHMVVALHAFTFLLFEVVLVVLPLSWMGENWGLPLYGPILIVLAGLPIWYAGETLHRCFGLRRYLAYPIAFFLMLGMILGNLVIYRFVQFALIFALI